jgi:hypothetical protein
MQQQNLFFNIIIHNFPAENQAFYCPRRGIGKSNQGIISQVYQFSRMYWKSVRQQNLPVTIKYPEMVAQIASHFDGDDIPDFGKDNLWFL